MTALLDPASANLTATFFSRVGTTNINAFYPYGVGPIGVTQTPRSLGYGSIGSYISALPTAYQASATSFSAFVPTLDTECDRIAIQTASNYVYDTYHAVDPTTNGSAAHFIFAGNYFVDDTIILNHAACWVDGAAPSSGYWGTSIRYSLTGTAGTLNLPRGLFWFYIQDDLLQPPPGRVAGIPNAPQFKMTHIVLNGMGGAGSSSVQSAGHGYIWAVRIGYAAFVHISECNFQNYFYDGIVFTGPQLFVVIEKCQFGAIARDGIANLKGPIAPQTNNSTTIWIYNNEFIGTNRYGIYLDCTGGAVQAMPIIRDNSFEHDNASSFYYLNPEWMVGGIRTWECFVGCANMIFEGNRFEGGGANLMWGCIAVIDGDGYRISNNNLGGSVVFAQTSPTQQTSDQLKQFWGVQPSQTTPTGITAITKANPAVVTTATPHGISNGDTVLIWGTALTMSQVQLKAFTAANVTSTTLELSGTNSTGYSTYSGTNGRIMNGQNWADITNARNYSLASPGDQQASGMDNIHLAQSYNYQSTIVSDGTGLAATGYNSVQDQAGTFFSIPTTNAPVATISNGGGFAKNMQQMDVAKPTLLNSSGVGNLRLLNCSWLSVLGQLSSAAFDLTPGQVTGDYIEIAAGVPWAASTAYTATFPTTTMFVRPITENGFFYQCTAVTGDAKSGSSEPTWPTTLNTTVVDNHVTWTCIGHCLMSGQGNLIRGHMDFGLRTVPGTASPSSGRWGVADRVRFTGPSSGNPPGTVCVLAGQPGTWKDEANLA